MMISKQTMYVRKYLGKNYLDHNDENEIDNDDQEADNEDQEVSWKEP